MDFFEGALALQCIATPVRKASRTYLVIRLTFNLKMGSSKGISSNLFVTAAPMMRSVRPASCMIETSPFHTQVESRSGPRQNQATTRTPGHPQSQLQGSLQSDCMLETVPLHTRVECRPELHVPSFQGQLFSGNGVFSISISRYHVSWATSSLRGRRQ